MVERLEIPPGISLGGKKVWFAGKVRDYLKSRADSVAQRSQRNVREIDRLQGSFHRAGRVEAAQPP
jgi:hypothetical protein